MDNEIIIYAKRDENGSIISISSNIYISDLIGWEQIDRWSKGEDMYLYAHADNGEYVVQKHGKPLYDEEDRPNFHDNFIEWSEEEKQRVYPIPDPEPSELEKIKIQQEVTDQAVQDLILMMMGGGE